MTCRLLYWLLWMVIGAMVMIGNAYAVDITPPGGTIPGEPQPPYRQVTYCPIHALEGFVRDDG